MSKEKKKKVHRCRVCGAEFDSKSLLDIHLKLHVDSQRAYDKVTVHGLDIVPGDCLKVAFSRFIYIIKVKSLTDNPLIVIAEDIYGKTLMLNLAKTFMIQKISQEDFEKRVANVKGKA